MWQITLFHIALMILLGWVLFISILTLAGQREDIHLKKRKKSTVKLQEISKTKISAIYIVILMLICSIVFLSIKLYIRGAR